jgi:hypothetical protein
MNYRVFDKDLFFETDHIIAIDPKTNEIKHEEKYYFYDGKELREIKSQQELNLKLYEISQKIQEEFAKFSAKYAKPPIGYMPISNILYEFMLNKNTVVLIAYANISRVENEITKEENKIILKTKTIINKEWNFESMQDLPLEVKDNIARIIEKALKSAMTLMKGKT